MKSEGLIFWEFQLEALQRTEQYVLNSLKLIQMDINSCKKRIEDCKNEKVSISEAINYRPYDMPWIWKEKMNNEI